MMCVVQVRDMLRQGEEKGSAGSVGGRGGASFAGRGCRLGSGSGGGSGGVHPGFIERRAKAAAASSSADDDSPPALTFHRKRPRCTSTAADSPTTTSG